MITTPPTVVSLYEWGERLIPEIVLSDRDRRLADTLGGIDIREMRHGVYIKASSWVGVVRFEAFTLRVKPKLNNLDLVRMILVTGGLDRLRRYRAERDYQLNEEASLFDLLAILLADACSALVRDGLLHDYVTEEDDLPVMRGRLRVSDQVRRRYGQVNRLECTYDDHHTDVLDNQILHTALALCRRYVQHPSVRGRIWQLADMFGAACGPMTGDWREIRSRLTYNRLNERYREAHTLAWIILSGLGVRDLLAAGDTHGFAFLLDMNPLFEAFITVLVQAALQKDDITVQAQAKSGGYIWDVGRDRSYKHIIPDLLLETSSGVRLAIDAKYKRYDEQKLAQSDIYQTFLYAYAFRDPEGMIPSAMLLYPAEGNAMKHTQLHIRDGRGFAQARLHALGIDVPLALKSLMADREKNVEDDLLSYLREMIHQLFDLSSIK